MPVQNPPQYLPQYLPMSGHDLADVAALDAAATPFPWQEKHFADALAAGYQGWVMRAGPDLLGQAVVMQVLDEAHLLTISIDPARQGQGLGGRLLSHLMRVAHEQGAATLLLEVRISNAAALRLYRNFGFQEIGRRKGYYPAAANGREDALIFQRALPLTPDNS